MRQANGKTDGKKRLYIFGAVMVLWVGAIGFRLVQLQVLRYGEFEQRAQRQQQRSIEVAPRRGVIYDRNRHELAMSTDVQSVFAVPSEVPDAASAAALIARVLRTEPGDISTRLKASHSFAWIARKLDPETAERIRALNLRGIYFQKEPRRFYPKRELAAQALGYVGMDDEGLAGVERSLDARLKGKPGRMQILRDARGRWFGRVEQQPVPGADVTLTLDEKIQYIAERELDQAMRDTHSEAGTIIVQNPHTGEILALASRPTFNPNNSRNLTPAQLKNRAVSDIYEPGSTFKIVTIAAALEEKVTRPEEVVDCQMGSIVISGLKIHDHHPFGNLTISEVVAHSSDVGAIKIGLRLGEERFDRYIRAFGFGSQTGIELPGETRGLTKPVSRWSKVSIGAISMGQEIGISALQLGGLISTIANGGQWMPARITMAGPADAAPVLQTAALRSSNAKPAERRAISPATAAQMKQMLRAVVEIGTGKLAQLDGYSAAGKTGTAQKTDPATGAYSKTKYVASFAGFAPIHDPAVTVVVILDSATGLHQGGQIAAPVFSRVTQQVLHFMNVPHDQEIKPKRRLLLASLRPEELEEAAPDHLAAALEPGPGEARPVQARLAESVAVPAAFKPSAGAAPAVPQRIEARTVASMAATVREAHVGPGAPARAAERSPATADPTSESGQTTVVEISGGVLVPSFVGKPLRTVVETAQEQGIEVDIIGSGVAREQSPAAGTRIPTGARVAVKFAR